MDGLLLNTVFEIGIRNPDQKLFPQEHKYNRRQKQINNIISKYRLFYKDKYLYYVKDYTMSVLKNH